MIGADRTENGPPKVHCSAKTRPAEAEVAVPLLRPLKAMLEKMQAVGGDLVEVSQKISSCCIILE